MNDDIDIYSTSCTIGLSLFFLQHEKSSGKTGDEAAKISMKIYSICIQPFATFFQC